MGDAMKEPANDNRPLDQDLECYTIQEGQPVFTCVHCSSRLFVFTRDVQGNTVIVCGGCGCNHTIDAVFGEYKYE